MKRAILVGLLSLFPNVLSAANLDLVCTTSDSSSISIFIDGDYWSIVHSITNGMTVKREVQYEIYSQDIKSNGFEWEGEHRTKPNIRMLGTIKNIGSGKYSYSETSYDDDKGGKKIASVSADCMIREYATPIKENELALTPSTDKNSEINKAADSNLVAENKNNNKNSSNFLYTIFIIFIIFIFGKLIINKIRRSKLLKKYKDELIVEKIISKEIWQGMTHEMLIDSRGKPISFDKETYKNKICVIFKYDKDGKNRYKTRITLEDDIVVGWKLR